MGGHSIPRCAECGARLDAGRICRDYFHDLLALEAQVVGAAGELPHFFAVAAYNLQHPSEFVPAALLGLRRTLGDVLAGRATIADARRRARAAADGSTRVRRRVDAPMSAEERPLLQRWPRVWELTVRDVCEVAPLEYAERTRAWATAVVAALDAAAV